MSIHIAFDGEDVRLSVSGDGVGLPLDYAENGHGFTNMSRVAGQLNGRLVVERKGPLGGATVTCVIPPSERG